MKVIVNGGFILDEKEVEAYKEFGRKKYPTQEIKEMELSLDGEFVDIKYTFKTQPMDRIRRITGYLVGTTERFNNAKKAEVDDRLKHGVSCCSDC